MAKWEVYGYFVMPVKIEVEADTASHAYDIGEEALRNGEGIDLPEAGAWQPDFHLYDEAGDEVPEQDLYDDEH